MKHRGWRLVAELDAVTPGTHRAMPRWESGVPYCREEGCVHYDGKRCILLGQRPDNICEPSVSGMAAVLDRRVQREAAATDPESEALRRRPDQEPR